MSPEQATWYEAVDGRADIYSLGAVAYYRLTCQPAFVSGNVIELIRAQASTEVSAPSRLNADIPADVEQIILHCLAKTPTTLYQAVFRLRTHSLSIRWRTIGDQSKQTRGGKSAHGTIPGSTHIGSYKRDNGLPNLDAHSRRRGERNGKTDVRLKKSGTLRRIPFEDVGANQRIDTRLLARKSFDSIHRETAQSALSRSYFCE